MQAGVTLREIVHDRLIKPHASSAALMQQQSLQTEVSTGVVRLMLPCGDLAAAGAPSSHHQEAFDREPISRFGSVISTFTGADVVGCSLQLMPSVAALGFWAGLQRGFLSFLVCYVSLWSSAGCIAPFCALVIHALCRSMPRLMAECWQQSFQPPIQLITGRAWLCHLSASFCEPVQT